MIVVIFEVTMNDGKADAYFELAASLRPALETIDGFISNERFESTATPGRYVSLSTWRDEAAVAAWHAQPDHGLAQVRGKSEIIADFRIRVASVLRDYSMADRTDG
ncbi:MAG: antibiotic biosynthesis monooxygenase [Alphaproteobacteria bacterium]